MALTAVSELLAFEEGSLVSFELSSNYELESLNFQTNTMGSCFIVSPSVLLLYRTYNPKGKMLYTFIVEVPGSPESTASAVKVIHFAVPKDDSSEALSELCKKFKEFNPSWTQIKTVLVDDSFTAAEVFKSEFQADVRLSIFHVAKIIQQQVYEMSLGLKQERLLLSALTRVVYTPTESNLEKLRNLFTEYADPVSSQHLNKHWLSNLKLWGIHKRERSSCRTKYVQDLEVIIQTIDDIATRDVGLEMFIVHLVKEVVQCCFIERLDNGMGPTTADSAQKTQEDDNRKNSLFFPDVSDTGPSTSKCCSSSRPNLFTQVRGELNAVQGEDVLKQSLTNICLEPAAVLCLNELAVTQKSVQLMGTNENDISTQLLEDAHVVTNDLKSCCCQFNQNYKLPCRHILAVLNANKSVVERHMIHDCWQRGTGDEDGDEGILEVLRNTWSKSAEKQLMKKSISQEINRLLTECSSEEFECRYSTLRELADNWIGPYIQVKL